MARRFDHALLLDSPRLRSEDRAEVLEHEGALIVIVADGAGGVRGGAAAAHAVVSATRRSIADRAFDVSDHGAWRRMLVEVDVALTAERTGETTAIVIVVSEHGLLGVSAGDSEAWVLTETGIDDLTTDQKKSRLGSGRAAPMTFARAALNGVLIAGSDGLFKYASATHIAATRRLPDLSETAKALVDLARAPSGTLPDDIAVAVIAAARS